jgi:hypothetical protein
MKTQFVVLLFTYTLTRLPIWISVAYLGVLAVFADKSGITGVQRTKPLSAC